VAVPYDLGTQRSTIHGFFGALYPIFVRGNAYSSRTGAPQRLQSFRRFSITLES
jgi:hypothetical protein